MATRELLNLESELAAAVDAKRAAVRTQHDLIHQRAKSRAVYTALYIKATTAENEYDKDVELIRNHAPVLKNARYAYEKALFESMLYKENNQ